MKSPTLAEIATEPSRIGELQAEAVAEVRGELARLDSLLLARLLNPNGSGPGEHTAQGDRRLNVDEAAAKLGVTKDYLYRHADSLPFTVRIGRGLGFSEQGIERYLRARAGR